MPNARIEIIQQAIHALSAHTYLEIGVAAAETFLSVHAPLKIGVDPKTPAKRLRDNLDNVTLKNYQMTSDQFFADVAPGLFSQHRIDVAFVDGLHEWRQALRDIENCLRFLSDPGLIIVHDCSPDTELTATPWETLQQMRRDSTWPGGSWCGDTFKAIACLRSHRTDLRTFVLDCDWGLGIVTKGEPEDTITLSMDEVERLTFQDLDLHRDQLLNLKPRSYFTQFLSESFPHPKYLDPAPYSC